ncbi:hypothetical protein [Streptomyces sp. NPDC014734]|uniref:hypothetical protein n=1 Tax=Streptomyces sp. NPDC014734 TaxID=3364886 RepID=UPI0036F66C18
MSSTAAPPPEEGSTSSGESASPSAGGSSPSDDEWAEFLRQAESGAGRENAPKEPSARARMVTARMRALDEGAAAARSRKGGRLWPGRKKAPVAGAWQPEGWRTGPEWRKNGRARQRSGFVSALAVLAVVALVLVAMRPSLLTDHLPWRDDASDTTALPPLPPESARPTSAPSTEARDDGPTLAEPFRGSPALRWADGADGIEVPPAKAVGGMSEQRVKHALSTMKKLLVATNLDPATLRGEPTGAALDLLEPRQKDIQTDFRTALDHPTKDHDPLALFTRFDPGQVRLVGDVVKTRGRMTFEAGKPGSVEVHADYTFVYPVRKAESGSSQVERTLMRRVLTLVLYDPAKWQTTADKPALVRIDYQLYNSACEVYDGYAHPQFPDDAPDPAATGSASDPYDRSAALSDDRKGCGTVTRT